MELSTVEEHNAVQNSVGFLDLSYRGKVEITGPDRISFLHSMISNDVHGVADYSGLYGTLLTPTGKMLSDFFYYRFPEFILLDIEPGLVPKTMETLQKYIIMEEVYLKDISDDVAHFSLQGPRAAELVQHLFGCELPAKEYQVQEKDWNGAICRLIRKSDLAGQGFEVWLSEKAAPSLRAEVVERGSQLGLRQVGEEARNILRTEAGIPWYGIDMGENHYPMEARLNNAISLTKGCYTGQEVVARATNLGGVPKLLMGLKIRCDSVPRQGAKVMDGDGKEVGTITSGVFSPRLKMPIAFAYLKRAFAVPGQTYQVQISPEQLVSAEVVDKFF